MFKLPAYNNLGGFYKEEIMDNFNNGMPDDVTSMVDDVVNQDPAADLANKMNADLGMTPSEASNSDSAKETGFKLAGDSAPSVEPETQPFAPQFGQQMGATNNQPQFGQPMGGMNNQPPFGQPMGGMNNQPPFGQPMGGMNNQPQFGQPMGGMNNQPQFGQQMGATNNQPQFGQPQFGQPMGGMNNQPQFGQPMGGMNNQPPKKPKKPLSKGAIGGIIGGGVALIALIVCAIIFIPKLFRSDKEVVVDAFEATFGVETEAKTEDTLGSDEIYDKFASDGGHREVYVEIGSDVDGAQSTVSAEVVEDIDVKGKLANTTFKVSMDESSILTANMVVDESNTYFQVPEMINGYFSLPNENMFQALENSPLGQAMEISGMPEFNMSDMYFNLATTGTPTELNSDYVAIVEELWDSITYEKQGKAKIDVNGKTVTAKEYYITLPEDSLKKAIGEIWDAAIAELTADPEYLAEIGMDAATFESMMGSYEGMLKGLITEDLVIKVYVSNDKIVKVVCADEVTIYGAALTYDLYIDIDDENASGVFDISVMDESVGLKFNAENINENPTGKVTLYAGSEFIDVNFKVTDNSSDSAKACNVYFDVVYNGTTYVTADTTVNYDTKANKFDGTSTVNIEEGGEIKFDFGGEVKDINKGVGYTIVLNESTISADGTPMLTMSGHVKVDASQHTAAGIDTSVPVYDLTTITESEFEGIMEENADLLQSWSDALGLDDYSGDDIDMDDTDLGVTEEPDDGKSILVGSEKSVEILGSLDGFNKTFDTDYFITYETDAMSFVEYVIYEGMTPQEVAEQIYMPSSDIISQEIAQTIEVDGETIYYSHIVDEEYGFKYSSYVFARDLGDGTILTVEAGIYDEEETFTVDQLAQAISNQYFKVVE